MYVLPPTVGSERDENHSRARIPKVGGESITKDRKTPQRASMTLERGSAVE